MTGKPLSELLDSLVAGDISPEDHKILQQELKKDADARAAFRERMDLEAGLRTWAATEATAPVARASQRIQMRSPSAGSMSFQRTVIASSIAAAILLAVGIPLVSLLRNDDSITTASSSQAETEQLESIQAPTGLRFVGHIRQQDDCKWSITPPTSSGKPINSNLRNIKLGTGRLLLAEGAAELVFESGTNLTLEAPCEIDVTSSISARLLAGSVFVDVTELSNGFTLSTPNSRIVDEGTEYGVSVGEDSTEVHVFDGQVVWVSEPLAGGSQPPFEERIKAGQARRFARTRPTESKSVTFGKRQFVRRIEQQIEESSGGNLIAYDGFENLAGRLRRGRSGLGWSGGWQPGSQGRGPLAEIVNSPRDTVFGVDRRGRRLLSLSRGSDIRRNFESPLALRTGEAIFVSFLISRGNEGAGAEERSIRLVLEPDLPGRGRRLHQVVSFGFSTEGYPFINSRSTISTTPSAILPNQTYLCVLKLETGAEGTSPLLRVYEKEKAAIASEPSSWTVKGQLNRVAHPPNSLRVITGKNAAWNIDELKVGTSWHAVSQRPIESSSNS